MSLTLSLSGFGPLPVERPTTVDDVGRLVRETRGRHQAVYSVGGRTLLDVGRTPVKPGIALDTTGLTDVVDYPARDMTVTVRAGLTVARLQELLAGENQWLPVDVAGAERATVGGAVATNAAGPHRWGYGTLRDYVIGIGFVSDDGVEVKGGGRVVKNVAGYDLMKLHTGAFGTLGVVTTVTFKVKPKPQTAIALVVHCTSGKLAEVLDVLHAGAARPVAVELLNANARAAVGISGPTDWTVVVGFEEKATTVAWQRDQLLDDFQRIGVTGITELHRARAVWESVTDLQIRQPSRCIAKASVRPSQLAALAVASDGDTVLIHGQPLNGILWRHGDRPTDPRFVIRRGDGNTMAQTDEHRLMAHIKHTLDPDDVFNPGRLFPSGA